MIAFELTMPNKGSWNNRWSGDTKRYIRCKREWGFSKETLEKIVNKDYTYSWNDGWTACVSVRKVDGKTAKHLTKISNGFYGYDWMISSIIRNGYIISPSEEEHQKTLDEIKK